MGKKLDILEAIYQRCVERNDMEFGHDDVKRECDAVNFRNPFDVTKIDDRHKLPQLCLNDDVFVAHLGDGRHMFIRGVSTCYHDFEPVPADCTKQWEYKRDLLAHLDTSASSIVSAVFNHHIIQDFLYPDELVVPNIYPGGRTVCGIDYKVEDVDISEKVQFEIDFTLEHDGMVTVFEAKNGKPDNFNVFQLFNPFQYYSKKVDNMKSLNCCYLLRHENRLRLYLYTFDDHARPASIRMLSNAEYILVEET